MKLGGKEFVFMLVTCTAFILLSQAQDTFLEAGINLKRGAFFVNEEIEMFSYMGLLVRLHDTVCRGVLISELAAFTAESCIVENEYGDPTVPGDDYHMVFGSVEKGKTLEEAKIKIIHLAEERAMGMAILNFVEAVQFTEYIKPIAISRYPVKYKEESFAYNIIVVGSDGVEKRFTYQMVKIMRSEKCPIDPNSHPLNSVVCTDRLAYTVCRESGSPLLLRRPEGDVLLGVLASRRTCNSNKPEMYASVSWYFPWIFKYADGRPKFVELEDV